jgi:hypothetical protein
MTDTAENYLYDVLPELINRAREARAEARREGKDQDGFEGGKALAYYEVVSYLVDELETFGIDRASVRIDPEFNADRDLL